MAVLKPAKSLFPAKPIPFKPATPWGQATGSVLPAPDLTPPGDVGVGVPITPVAPTPNVWDKYKVAPQAPALEPPSIPLAPPTLYGMNRSGAVPVAPVYTPTPATLQNPIKVGENLAGQAGEAIGGVLGGIGEGIGNALGKVTTGPEISVNVNKRSVVPGIRFKPEAVNAVASKLPKFAQQGLSETTPNLINKIVDTGIPPIQGATDWETANPLEKSGAMVVSFAADPLTYLTFGLGGAAGKATANLLGKKLAADYLKAGAGLIAKGVTPPAIEFVPNLAGKVAGRLLPGMVGGAVGLGAYQGAKSVPEQLDTTGTVNPVEVASQAGQGALLGGALGAVGKIAEPFGKVASFGAETATLGSIPAVTERRLPTVEDYVVAAGMVAGMKASGAVGRGLFKLAKGITNLTPNESAATANVSPKDRANIIYEVYSEKTGTWGAPQSKAAQMADNLRAMAQKAASVRPGFNVEDVSGKPKTAEEQGFKVEPVGFGKAGAKLPPVDLAKAQSDLASLARQPASKDIYTAGEDRYITSTVEGTPAWSNGFIMEIGEPSPLLANWLSSKAGPPSKMSSFESVTNSAKNATDVVAPVGVTVVMQNKSGTVNDPGSSTPALILTNQDGAPVAVNPAYFSYLQGQHPDAKWVMNPSKSDAPVALVSPEGKLVGAVMPMLLSSGGNLRRAQTLIQAWQATPEGQAFTDSPVKSPWAPKQATSTVAPTKKTSTPMDKFTKTEIAPGITSFEATGSQLTGPAKKPATPQVTPDWKTTVAGMGSTDPEFADRGRPVEVTFSQGKVEAGKVERTLQSTTGAPVYEVNYGPQYGSLPTHMAGPASPRRNGQDVIMRVPSNATVRFTDEKAAQASQKPEIKVGDRVDSWQGKGTIHSIQGNDVRIYLEDKGEQLSKFMPLTDVKPIAASSTVAPSGIIEGKGIANERSTAGTGTQPGVGLAQPGERGVSNREPLAGPEPQVVQGAGAGRGTPEVLQAGSTTTPGERTTPSEAGQPAGRGVERSVEGTGSRPRRQLETPASAASQSLSSPHDYVISDADQLGTGGIKARFQQNLKAIQIAKQLGSENRPATSDEQAELVKYVGWGDGGFNGLFGTDWSWRTERDALRAEVTDAEYKAMELSRLNAHYTSPEVIRAMWGAVDRLISKDVSHLRALEPSAGIGHFFGLMPAERAVGAERTAIELDTLTGAILKGLYPKADVHITGYQDAPIPLDYYDVALTNAPFGNYGIADLKMQRRNRDLTKAIHNYFFAKALDNVRPGGLVAFITSRYTMDSSTGVDVRKYLASKAELIGAYRLPDTAFAKNAGTEVVTDIIFLRKYLPGETPSQTGWVDLGKIDVTIPATRYTQAKVETVPINEYFVRHPENVMGEHAMTGSMYAENTYTVTAPEGYDIGAALDTAFKKLPKGIIGQAPSEARMEAPTVAPKERTEGAFYFEGKQLYHVVDRNAVKVTLTPAGIEQTKGLLDVRDAAREALRVQLAGAPDAEVETARKQLNVVYDKFVTKHGPLNGRVPSVLLAGDPDLHFLKSLEKWNDGIKAKVGKVAPKELLQSLKMPIFSKNVVKGSKPIETAATAQDAMFVSLNETGTVDVARIVALTGKSEAVVTKDLGDRVFHNPLGGWEIKEKYLSGNVKEKLDAAKSAAKRDPEYQRNVDALAKVIPEDRPPSKIEAKLGATWVPEGDVKAFVNDLMESRYPEGLTIQFVPEMGKWLMKADPNQMGISQHANVSEWGTETVPFIARRGKGILEHALDGTQPKVFDKEENGPDQPPSLNPTKTFEAQAKLDKVQAEFAKWLWQDDARALRLSRLYNDTFNVYVRAQYDGSYLTLPGINPDISLRPHQVDAVARILQSGNTLLAHVVGAGKTFEMQAAGMEMRRLGIAKKVVFVTPNPTLSQFVKDFYKLYPNARILTPEKGEFTRANRRTFLNRIATGDWDAIVLPQSQFTLIQPSEQARSNYIQEEIDNLIRVKSWLVETGQRKSQTHKDIQKAIESLHVRLKNEQEKMQERQDPGLTWEGLGIDALIVDESDMYKGLPIVTAKERVKGMSTGKSQRAEDMYIKTRLVHQRTGNRGVVFATGTPIANTIAEMYTVLRYLMPDELAAKGINHFDAWASQYARDKLDMEQTVTGKIVPTIRFKEFVNKKELSAMFQQVADVMMKEDVNLPVPKLVEGKRVMISSPSTPELIAGIESLAARIGRLSRATIKQDNMLKITSDARWLSLTATDKIDRAADNIAEVYKDYDADKAAQIVFLDLGVPKVKDKTSAVEDRDGDTVDPDDTVDELTAEEAAMQRQLYNRLRVRLLARQIPADQIAFVQDVKDPKKLTDLWSRVKSGDIRVIVGSTAKLGQGVNVQDRLVALHHIDPAWTPRALEQREGRILRQGNMFGPTLDTAGEPIDEGRGVHIFNYVAEGSFDGYMWQAVHAKAQGIRSLIRREVSDESIEDIDEFVVDAAMATSLASGDPRVMRRAILKAELTTLTLSKDAWKSTVSNARMRMVRIKNEILQAKVSITALTEDIGLRNANPVSGGLVIGKTAYTEAKDIADALEAIFKKGTEPKQGRNNESHLALKGERLDVGSYRGFKISFVQYDRGYGWETALRMTSPKTSIPYQTTGFNPEQSPASGWLDRMNNTIGGLDKELKMLKDRLQTGEKELPRFEAEMNRPFSDGKRLQETLLKLAATEADMASSEGKPGTASAEVMAQIRAMEAEGGQLAAPTETAPTKPIEALKPADVAPVEEPAPKQPVAETAELPIFPDLTVGDKITMMQVPSILTHTKTIDSMKYELFKGDNDPKSTVRVTDMDSGNVVTIKQYPTYFEADSAYLDGITGATKAEQPAGTPTTAEVAPLSEGAKTAGFATEAEYQAFLNEPLPEPEPTPELYERPLAEIQQETKNEVARLKKKRAEAMKGAKSTAQKNAVKAEHDPKIRREEDKLKSNPKIWREAVKKAIDEGKIDKFPGAEAAKPKAPKAVTPRAPRPTKAATGPTSVTETPQPQGQVTRASMDQFSDDMLRKMREKASDSLKAQIDKELAKRGVTPVETPPVPAPDTAGGAGEPPKPPTAVATTPAPEEPAKPERSSKTVVEINGQTTTLENGKVVTPEATPPAQGLTQAQIDAWLSGRQPTPLSGNAPIPPAKIPKAPKGQGAGAGRPRASRGAGAGGIPPGGPTPPPAGAGGATPPGGTPPGTTPTPPTPPTPPVAAARAFNVIPGEDPARAAMREWAGSRDTLAMDAQVWWEKGQELLKASGFTRTRGKKVEVNKAEMLDLFRALHGEQPPPARLQGVYDVLRGYMDAEGADMLATDPEWATILMAHPDYFPRGWREPKKTPAGAGAMGSKPGFKKPRNGATFSEMVDNGWEPISWNPFDMAVLRRIAGVEYRENKILIQRLKQSGMILPVSKAPSGWRVPKAGPAFEGKPYVDKAGKVWMTSPLAVPPKVAGLIEGVYGVRPTMMMGSFNLLTPIRIFTNGVKRSKLLMSLFQHVDFASRAGAVSFTPTGITRGLPLKYPGLLAQMMNVSLRATPRDAARAKILSGAPLGSERGRSNPISLRMIAEEGWQIAGDPSIMRRDIVSAVNAALKSPPNAGLRILTAAHDRVMSVPKFFESGLFDGVYRITQSWALDNFIVPRLRRSHPTWTSRQIAASAAEEVNKMFSALGEWQTIFQQPAFKEFSRMVIFSTNESEAWLRAGISTVHGQNKRLWGEYWIGFTLFLATMANLINLASTGKPLDADQYSPIKFGDRYSPLPGGLAYNSRFMSPMLPWKGADGRDLYLDLVAQADTVFRWILDPFSSLGSRLNVIPRALVNQIEGKSFFGVPMTTPMDRLGQAAQDLAMPIGAGNVSEALRQINPEMFGGLPMGERRVGITGSILQGTGLNIRATTNTEYAAINDQIAMASPAHAKWDDLSPRDQLTLRKQNPQIGQVESQMDAGRAAEKTGILDMTAQLNEGKNVLGKLPQPLQNALTRNGVGITMERSITIPKSGGVSFYLNDARFQRYKDLTLENLNGLLPKYAGGSKEVISKVVSVAKEAARAKLMAEMDKGSAVPTAPATPAVKNPGIPPIMRQPTPTPTAKPAQPAAKPTVPAVRPTATPTPTVNPWSKYKTTPLQAPVMTGAGR